MSRNRRAFRDRDGGRRDFGGHDGLLGEGPGRSNNGGGMLNPIMSNQMTQMNQLMLAQQLLQKQALLSAGFGGGGDLGALAGAVNNMQMMQQQQQMQHALKGGFGGGPRGGVNGGDHHHHHRKRVGVQQDRDMDSKRRRRDSFGRSGDHDRFHGREDNRGSDGTGRDRNRSSRWEPVEERPKKKDDTYDPAEPTEDEESANNKDLYCHVCNVSVYDGASFRRHLNGTKHQARMNSVLTVHQMKSSQLQSRLKAEEHLRKIEGKAGGFDPDYFCKICNNELTIPWDRHRFSNIHKQRQLQVKRGCGWCNVHDFNNFTEVLEHRETDQHKKNAEVHGKKPGEKKNEKQPSGSSTERKGRPKIKEEEEDLTIPEFNSEVPVGQNFIIPVTGFFCKLCNKFYNNEKSAKVTHCQTEAHYEKFKLAMEAKIAAREEKKAEEAAAAAAEAERRAAEAEKAGEEGNKDNEMEEVKRGVGEEEDYDDDLPLEDSDDEGGLVKFIANNGDDEKDDSEMEISQAAEESLLNETSANESFTFLSGDQAQAHIEQQSAADIFEDVTKAAGLQSDEGADEKDDEDTDIDGASESGDLTAESVKIKEKEETSEAGECTDDAGINGIGGDGSGVDDIGGEGNGANDMIGEDNGINDMGVSGDGIGVNDMSGDGSGANDMSGEGSGLSQEEVQPMSTPVAAAVKPTRGKGTARRGRGRGKAKK
ncbi:Cdkn1a interacting zinc finger protein 1a [Elysia marginata]|uniref:Cdkn1a interacting zinc finger protein 1a n=1 Tax=Elysia marginata TaxID=1093978 RepID=A0AAV4G174_9GAST|nr:Cdkn1a interacting zinc finger protein 1a [Elysia marginata]